MMLAVIYQESIILCCSSHQKYVFIIIVEYNTQCYEVMEADLKFYFIRPMEEEAHRIKSTAISN